MEKLSKRFIASVLAVMTVLLTVVAGFSGTAHADEVVVLNSIIVTEVPDKTEYYVGDALDTSGILLAAKFSDGSSVGVTSGVTYSPTVLNNPGVQTITVSYSGVTTSFKVTVYDYATTVPAVTDAPSTTRYDEYITTTTATYPHSATTAPTTVPSTFSPAEVTTRGPVVSSTEGIRPTTRPAQATTTRPATTKPVVHTTAPATRPDSNNEYIMIVNSKKNELNYGQGTSVEAIVTPDIKGNLYIVWSSSDTSVATVNQKGFVTACGEGDVIITATLVDENGRAVIDPYGDEISESVVIKCSMTIWQKIAQFFRNLFGGLFF